METSIQSRGAMKKPYKTSLANFSRKLSHQLELGRTVRMTNNNSGIVWEFDKSNNRNRFKNETNHAYTRVRKFLVEVQEADPSHDDKVFIPFQIIEKDGRLFEEFEAQFKPVKALYKNSQLHRED